MRLKAFLGKMMSNANADTFRSGANALFSEAALGLCQQGQYLRVDERKLRIRANQRLTVGQLAAADLARHIAGRHMEFDMFVKFRSAMPFMNCHCAPAL